MQPTFRTATRDDTALVLGFVKQLADYEHMTQDVVATEELYEEWLFDKGAAEVLFVCEDEHEVGFALYYRTFSTFLGRGGIHLEDLFVKPEFRGKGYGTALICRLAAIAVSEGCGRLEWDCLDWNEPSLAFYRNLGAERLNEWVGLRVSGKALEELAGRDSL